MEENGRKRVDTHILYQFGTSPATTATNDRGGEHAEIELIDILKEQMVRDHQCNEIFLSMHMNRSPCGDCAESLIEFKKKPSNTQVVILQ